MMVHTNIYIYIHNYITYNRLVRQTMIQLYIASPLKTHIESPRNIISPHIFASFSIIFGRSTRIFVPSSTAMPTSSVAPASWTSWRRRPVKTHGFSEGFSKKTQSNEWYVQLFFLVLMEDGWSLKNGVWWCFDIYIFLAEASPGYFSDLFSRKTIWIYYTLIFSTKNLNKQLATSTLW